MELKNFFISNLLARQPTAEPIGDAPRLRPLGWTHRGSEGLTLAFPPPAYRTLPGVTWGGSGTFSQLQDVRKFWISPRTVRVIASAIESRSETTRVAVSRSSSSVGKRQREDKGAVDFFSTGVVRSVAASAGEWHLGRLNLTPCDSLRMAREPFGLGERNDASNRHPAGDVTDARSTLLHHPPIGQFVHIMLRVPNHSIRSDLEVFDVQAASIGPILCDFCRASRLVPGQYLQRERRLRTAKDRICTGLANCYAAPFLANNPDPICRPSSSRLSPPDRRLPAVVPVSLSWWSPSRTRSL